MYGNNRSINESLKEYVELCIAQSYFSETVVNFHVDLEKGNIVIPFSNLGFSNVEEYLTNMGNNLIKRHFGYISDADKTFYRDSFPFGLSDGELVCDENDEPEKLIVPITPQVALNIKRLVISEIHRNVESRMLVNFKKEGKSREKALEILKQVQLMPVDKSLPYGCRVRISDSPLVDNYIKEFEYLVYERHGQNRNLKFYKLSKNKNELSFINIDNSAFINGVKEGMIKAIARDFRTSGIIEEPKIKNLKNALAKVIFEFTGKVVKGFDIIQHTERDDNFSLVPLVELNGQLRFLSSEDKVRFNEKCRRDGLGDNVSTDTYIKDVGNTPAFSREGLITLIPKFMKFPIGYNERSGRYEYAVNLGNLCLEKQRDTQPEVTLQEILDNSCLEEQHDTQPEVTLQEILDNSCLEKQHNAPPKVTSKQNTNFLSVSQSTGEKGSTASICTINSTDSRSVSPMPRNHSDNALPFRDRSDSKVSKDSGTYGSVGSMVNSNPANAVSSNSLSRKAPMVTVEETSKENSLEHSLPAESSSVASAGNQLDSSQRSSKSSSSFGKTLHSLANAVKEIFRFGGHTSSSEVGGPKVKKQSEENKKKDKSQQADSRSVSPLPGNNTAASKSGSSLNCNSSGKTVEETSGKHTPSSEVGSPKASQQSEENERGSHSSCTIS